MVIQNEINRFRQEEEEKEDNRHNQGAAEEEQEADDQYNENPSSRHPEHAHVSMDDNNANGTAAGATADSNEAENTLSKQERIQQSKQAATERLRGNRLQELAGSSGSQQASQLNTEAPEEELLRELEENQRNAENDFNESELEANMQIEAELFDEEEEAQFL